MSFAAGSKLHKRDWAVQIIAKLTADKSFLDIFRCRSMKPRFLNH